MDGEVPGLEVHEVNVLTVIASESYESFVRGLQEEITEVLASRPQQDDSGMFPVADGRQGKGHEPEQNAAPDKTELQRHIGLSPAAALQFDSEMLICSCVEALDSELDVSKVQFRVQHGGVELVGTKAQREESYPAQESRTELMQAADPAPASAPAIGYDLVGRLAEETRLTRKTIVRILTGIRAETFEQLQRNPEEFILRTARIVNGRKAAIRELCGLG
jgi:type III restriction enzyme